MPSPFPGMNPYLETPDAWRDFHDRFIPTAAAALEEPVGEDYIVQINETPYVRERDAEEGDPRQLLGRGDVLVGAAKNKAATRLGRSAAAIAPAPARGVVLTADTDEQTYIIIRDRRDRSLVTVIELLSPSNKEPGDDRRQYLAKRQTILESPTHLVEIDLLRGKPRLPVRGLPPCDYCVVVSRALQRPDAELWPLGLRDPLPVVPIPLRDGEPDAPLDLQALLHRVYDGGSFRKYIYEVSLEPPLAGGDADWVRSIVAGRVS